MAKRSKPQDDSMVRGKRRCNCTCGKRIADKLFKIWLRDGSERWLFIHIEVQGDYDEEFSQRIFDYNSAVRKLYNQTVVSLAVLCDDRPEGFAAMREFARFLKQAKSLDDVRDYLKLSAQ